MLQYKSILTSPNKEVRDPVSGHSFPLSVQDVHSIESQRESEKANRDMFNQLISLTK